MSHLNEPDANDALGASKTDLVKHKLQQEATVLNVKKMLNKMTKRCFKKCVPRPTGSLGDYEQKCIALCVDRYMESYKMVARTYGNRLQREQAKLNTVELGMEQEFDDEDAAATDP